MVNVDFKLSQVKQALGELEEAVKVFQHRIEKAETEEQRDELTAFLTKEVETFQKRLVAVKQID